MGGRLMIKMQRQVQEFHRDVLNGPTSPAEPKLREPELRARLILEEALECVISLVGGEKARDMYKEMRPEFCREENGDWIQPDLVNAIKELTDILYVVFG